MKFIFLWFLCCQNVQMICGSWKMPLIFTWVTMGWKNQSFLCTCSFDLSEWARWGPAANLLKGRDSSQTHVTLIQAMALQWDVCFMNHLQLKLITQGLSTISVVETSLNWFIVLIFSTSDENTPKRRVNVGLVLTPRAKKSIYAALYRHRW